MTSTPRRSPQRSPGRGAGGATGGTSGGWWPLLLAATGEKKDDEAKGRDARRRVIQSTVGIAVAVVLAVAGLHAAASLSSRGPGPGGPGGWRGGLAHLTSGPRLPHEIHFTLWDSKDVPVDIQANIDSWKDANPEWEVKVWDDVSMAKYVKRYYPKYYQAYEQLPKNVERSDLFRYLLLLRDGGVYADADTKCLRPLSDYLSDRGDGLVVGWDDEWVDEDDCLMAESGRKRVLLQWVMASTPGHPALASVASHIVEHANRTFSKNAARDTSERTGPFVFTDLVLRWSKEHPPNKKKKHAVTFLPRSVWGNPRGARENPDKAAEHNAMGSWRDLETAGFGPCGVSEFPLAPVSVPWKPRFTLMTHLSGGAGDPDCGEDVCADLNTFGMWQAGLSPTAMPSVLQVLGAVMVDAYAGHGSGMFVDVGAGYGLYTLGMAAMGFDTVAFEMGTKSLQALNASVQYAGWDNGRRVSIVAAALGNATEEVCVSRKWPGAPVEEQRGYLRPSQRLPASIEPECLSYGPRVAAAKLLRDTPHTHVLRVNANGHEPSVVEGLSELMHKGLVKPYGILLTWQPMWMEEVSAGSAKRALGMLRELGYDTAVIASSGAVGACEGEDDFGASLFGLEPSTERGVQWCLVREDKQLLPSGKKGDKGKDKSNRLQQPSHLLLLRGDLHLRMGAHRLDGHAISLKD